MNDDKSELLQQLQRLRAEHRALDEKLNHLMNEPIVDHLALQSMKKRKLTLKDQIVQLEHYLFPNIIA